MAPVAQASTYISWPTFPGDCEMRTRDAFERATGQEIERKVGPRRSGDIEQIYAACEKGERVLGWKATRTVEDAMRDAWRWQKRLGRR